MEAVKNTELIRVLVPLFIIVFIIAVGVVLLYQHFQKNLFIHKLKEETLRRSHQTELLRANIQAQEEERKRIAQDMHDELGAVLSIMRMNMLMLERQSAEASPGLVPGLQNVRSLAESALADMRSISHRLMPPQLETFGLVKTLEAVAARINEGGTLHITLLAPCPLAGIPWPVSLGMYRIVMELINNTIKHSGAARAGITIDEEEGCVVCRYTDNGRGIAGDTTGTGLGMKNISGRISALDGTFESGTGQGGGFYAVIRVPVHAGA